MSMVGDRIKLSDIKARIVAQFAAASPVVVVARVGTVYERDYLTVYPTLYPAIWVAGQNLTPLDDGTGYSSQFRQRCAIEIGIRVVVARYADAMTDPETQMNLLFKATTAAVKDWTPPNAGSPMVWRRGNDGPGNESTLTADLYFATEVAYQRTTP